jgi:hypothetical protein
MANGSCSHRARPSERWRSQTGMDGVGAARSLGYDSPMLSPGELAPDFDVEAHDGSRVKLSDLAGKYVLLWFYPMADTPG